MTDNNKMFSRQRNNNNNNIHYNNKLIINQWVIYKVQNTSSESEAHSE